jgi:hypothetical protein
MGNYAFYHEHGVGDIGLNDPVFLQRLKEAQIDPQQDPKKAGAKWMDENIWHGHSHTWAKIPWLMEQWKTISGGKPFCLKGIQSVADAKKAVELGVDGIVVSNHAGRQVDGAIASLDALEKITAAVGDQITVMFDSGVRTGADVFKALALGAKFVFIGRLWVSTVPHAPSWQVPRLDLTQFRFGAWVSQEKPECRMWSGLCWPSLISSWNARDILRLGRSTETLWTVYLVLRSCRARRP